MNFLAHIYLSKNSNDITIGNFIADYVKGSEFNKYPKGIKNGILLHRKIDYFTDNHTIVKEDKKLFAGRYHKYAGVITDILYDHFLAVNWNHFSEFDFDMYIANVYDLLEQNIKIVPDPMQQIIPRFIKNNWLKAYQTPEGIKSVFIGMSKSTSLPDETDYAMHIFNNHYNELKHHFHQFFPSLVDYIDSETLKLEEENLR